MKSTPLEWPLITTSDTVDFTDAAGNVITGVGLWVSVAGTIKVKWGSGRVETLDATTVPAGEQFWGLIKRYIPREQQQQGYGWPLIQRSANYDNNQHNAP